MSWEPLTVAETIAYNITGAVVRAIYKGQLQIIYCDNRKLARKTREALAQMKLPKQLRRLIKVMYLPTSAHAAAGAGATTSRNGAKHAKKES